MDSVHVYALNAAKEITVSRMINTNLSPTKSGGECVAEFYEAVYRKVLELAKESED